MSLIRKTVSLIRKPKTVRFSIPEDVIPNGLQIMARETNNLSKGFPYPEALGLCGVLEREWQILCDNLAYPVFLDGDVFNSKSMRRAHGYNAERILDIAVKWDVHYFRPKGIIMRLDMPGEEKFGLEFMDIYHYPKAHGHAHVDNFLGSALGGDTRRKQHKPRYLNNLRLLGRETTRIVVDCASVLQNLGQAYERGWANWIKACGNACELSLYASPEERPEESLEVADSKISDETCTILEKCPKHYLDESDRKQLGGASMAVEKHPISDRSLSPRHSNSAPKVPERASEEEVDAMDSGQPSSVCTPSEEHSKQDVQVTDSGQRKKSVRVMRWPPSKLLYYDRFRGTQTENIRQRVGNVVMVCYFISAVVLLNDN
jgi:hypothetical protein